MQEVLVSNQCMLNKITFIILTVHVFYTKVIKAKVLDTEYIPCPPKIIVFL